MATVIEHAWESLSNTLRLFVEVHMDFAALYAVDRPDAVTRQDRVSRESLRSAFAAMVWLAAGCCSSSCRRSPTSPSQLGGRGAQTLLPSVEAAYPWVLALLGTSLFAGFGIARRRARRGRDAAAPARPRRRHRDGPRRRRGHRVHRGRDGQRARPARPARGVVAVRADRPRAASRRRATAPSRSGRVARPRGPPDGDLDGRPIGTIDLAGERSGADFRWLAYVATTASWACTARPGSATDAWVREPFAGWRRATPAEVAGRDASTSRRSASRSRRRPGRRPSPAASTSSRARAPGIAGSRSTARRSGAAFPQVAWLVGDDDLARWRGQLDYWVFLDGQLGRIAGSVNGDAADIRDGALQAHDPGRPDGDRPRARVDHLDRVRDAPDARRSDGRRRRWTTSHGPASATASPGSPGCWRCSRPTRTGCRTAGRSPARVGMSVRTVYRDLSAIEGELGIPLWSEGGRWGVDGDGVPAAAQAHPDEAMAVVLSARLMVRYADKYDPDLGVGVREARRGPAGGAARARRADARRAVAPPDATTVQPPRPAADAGLGGAAGRRARVRAGAATARARRRGPPASGRTSSSRRSRPTRCT